MDTRFACSVAAAILALALMTPATAQETEPDPTLPQASDAPLPEERPELPGDAEPSDDADQPVDGGEAEEEAPEDVPVPDERPEEDVDEDSDDADADAGTDADADAGEVEEEPVEEEITEPLPPEPEDAAALRACRAELRGLGAEFTLLDTIEPEGAEQAGCGVDTPFAVTSILPGIALEPETQMRCATALALAKWVRGEVLPAARALELGQLTTLNHGSTYVCRPRNNVEEADISEHALGNAIDIMSFTFESGEAITVSPKEGDGDASEAFQKAVGSGACLHFTTVLGPGSDAYHDDHLHLDIAKRSSDYRLCQTP
ncbi:extensin family protein [Rhizobium sp. EC-SD404]|uniref:extensin-like domain-containing protein n=1 Tax=Rhizobium sp. EC-SD404 TaxID=2038389 RepID=UPI00125263EA|nr:extensin family protein [Rhizobium sp. EC-SD404]VVT10467.1 conserved exported hypothetical protein [Rhizobium sp. EC-SD404]